MKKNNQGKLFTLPAWGKSILFAMLLLLLSNVQAQETQNVNIEDGSQPLDLAMSQDWTATQDGQNLDLYTVSTLSGNRATFGKFELRQTTELVLHSAVAIQSVTIRPLSRPTDFQIVNEHEIRLTLQHPGQYTVELNQAVTAALHLFANPSEEEPLTAASDSVIYYGPGLHEISHLELQSGQTLYLAEGAIVRAIIPPDEPALEGATYYGYKGYLPIISARHAENITIRGRGILDMSALPWHSRRAVEILDSKNILIEGIIMLNSPTWNLAMGNCEQVVIRNVKQIASEDTSSDGIDLQHCRDVLVEQCFMRNDDDAICVKTPWNAAPAENIMVRRCTIWNERARALGVISETRQDVRNVVFQDCDVIHDFSDGGDCAALGILVSDSGTMSNIVFDDIRIEDTKQNLIYCWIGSDVWGQDDQRGQIRNVIFSNIMQTSGTPGRIVLQGYNEQHGVENIMLDRVRCVTPMTAREESCPIEKNEFVKNILIL